MPRAPAPSRLVETRRWSGGGLGGGFGPLLEVAAVLAVRTVSVPPLAAPSSSTSAPLPTASFPVRLTPAVAVAALAAFRAVLMYFAATVALSTKLAAFGSMLRFCRVSNSRGGCGGLRLLR